MQSVMFSGACVLNGVGYTRSQLSELGRGFEFHEVANRQHDTILYCSPEARYKQTSKVVDHSFAGGTVKDYIDFFHDINRAIYNRAPDFANDFQLREMLRNDWSWLYDDVHDIDNGDYPLMDILSACKAGNLTAMVRRHRRGEWSTAILAQGMVAFGSHDAATVLNALNTLLLPNDTGPGKHLFWGRRSDLAGCFVGVAACHGRVSGMPPGIASDMPGLDTSDAFTQRRYEDVPGLKPWRGDLAVPSDEPAEPTPVTGARLGRRVRKISLD